MLWASTFLITPCPDLELVNLVQSPLIVATTRVVGAQIVVVFLYLCAAEKPPIVALLVKIVVALMVMSIDYVVLHDQYKA